MAYLSMYNQKRNFCVCGFQNVFFCVKSYAHKDLICMCCVWIGVISIRWLYTLNLHGSVCKVGCVFVCVCELIIVAQVWADMSWSCRRCLTIVGRCRIVFIHISLHISIYMYKLCYVYTHSKMCAYFIQGGPKIFTRCRFSATLK